VLRPLLFLLYINDLPLNIHDAMLVLYADDINIPIIDKNIDAVQASLNRVIKQFENWLSNNSLIYNTDKTKAMLLHLNRTCNLVMRKIFFKNVDISYTSEVKFLGINISNLKWNMHIQCLCSKLNKVSYMISSQRGDLSLFVLRNVYFTKFQSLIRYGIILLGGERESLQVLEIRKRVLRSIKGLHNESIVNQFLKS